MRLSDVMRVAHASGWQVKYINSEGFVIGFIKNGVLMNVRYKTNIVSTTLVHPKMGKNKLYRKGINAKVLEIIMENPRYHTGRGYRIKKKQTQKPIPVKTCSMCGESSCLDCWLEEPHYQCEHSTNQCSIKRLNDVRISRTP